MLVTLCRALACLVLASLPSAQDLLVSSRNTDEVLRYDGTTGAFVGVFASGGGLGNPVGLTFGPDGNLYVASADNNRILRYDGQTGAFINRFAFGGGLNGPRQINFGPDGHLYVASGASNQILRYDGRTGAQLGVFALGGNLQGPNGFTFDSNGDLYVASVLNNFIKRYDGRTGAFKGNFASTNLNGPHDVAFGPDGRLYVTNAFHTRIGIYNPSTGAFIANLLNDATLSAPLGMIWDGARGFYVANQGGNEVRKYNARSGQFVNSFVQPAAGGLDSPLYLTFFPTTPSPVIEPVFPGNAGFFNYLRFSGFEPGRKVYLAAGTPAPPLVLGCGITIDLALPVPLKACIADESGSVVLGGLVPTSLAGVTLHLQAFAPKSCQATSVASITF